MCPPCKEIQDREAQARWHERDAYFEQRRNDFEERIARGGYWMDHRGEPVWLNDEGRIEGAMFALNDSEHALQWPRCTNPNLRPIDFDRVWKEGGDLILMCLNCRSTVEIGLLRWIPETVDTP